MLKYCYISSRKGGGEVTCVDVKRALGEDGLSLRLSLCGGGKMTRVGGKGRGWTCVLTRIITPRGVEGEG
ncbi:unnamed protein product [Onchocerca flexuosa]|uniref:DUF448 domain-containing protein n=1 Tax=Onchocerca flexuosa TaxID=387005 RepID=A0A183I5F7_9BILA|nr:unnamed protein product [Onchocerca flexuosa]